MDLPVFNQKYPEPVKISDYVKYAEIRQMADNINHLYLKNVDHPVSMAILGANPEEGKTFFIISMGVALSRYFGKKVLIVDTIEDNKFLKSIEEGMDQTDKIINTTVFDDLSVVHLSDLKVHEYQIDSILSSFEDEYDVILFDTISLNLKNIHNIDPFAVAKRCEHRFLVVNKKSINNAAISKLNSDFKKSDISLTGVIYNEMVIKK